MTFPYKTTQKILIAISITSFIWVIYKLWTFAEWDHFILHLKNHQAQIPNLLFFQVVLLTLNIGIEARKWQLLATPVSSISFLQSLKHVIKGIQLGLITPARTGEPIGKSVFFKSSDKPKIVLLSLAGSTIQNFVILLSTIVAYLWIESGKEEFLLLFTKQLSTPTLLWFVPLMLPGIILFILISKKFSYPRRIIHYFSTHSQIIKQVKTSLIINVGILTIMRYMVFCLQFLLLLQFFGLTGSANGLFPVFLFYGAITFLPSTGAGDLGIRATVALLIFGQTAVSGPGIVIASMLLWFFNLGLPALIPIFKPVLLILNPAIQKKTIPTGSRSLDP